MPVGATSGTRALRGLPIGFRGSSCKGSSRTDPRERGRFAVRSCLRPHGVRNEVGARSLARSLERQSPDECRVFGLPPTPGASEQLEAEPCSDIVGSLQALARSYVEGPPKRRARPLYRRVEPGGRAHGLLAAAKRGARAAAPMRRRRCAGAKQWLLKKVPDTY